MLDEAMDQAQPLPDELRTADEAHQAAPSVDETASQADQLQGLGERLLLLPLLLEEAALKVEKVTQVIKSPLVDEFFRIRDCELRPEKALIDGREGPGVPTEERFRHSRIESLKEVVEHFFVLKLGGGAVGAGLLP